MECIKSFTQEDSVTVVLRILLKHVDKHMDESFWWRGGKQRKLQLWYRQPPVGCFVLEPHSVL